MTPAQRLVRFACLLVLLAVSALWITRESLRPREPLQATGLRWLKEEYQLDEATFSEVEKLHRAYFATCDKMCRQIQEAARPLSRRARQGPPAAALQHQEQRLCDECEETARHHLRQVAALMPPEQGRRFLDHMLLTLETQRRVHDLQMSASTRQ